MKALFDLFPVAAFFVAYMAFGRDIYLATKVIMAAMLVQVAILWLRERKVSNMHLASAALVWALGGVTLLLHDPRFIKWKPTIVYWLFAGAFIASQYVGAKPLIRRMQEHLVKLEDRQWNALNWAWGVFFAFLGALNLYVVDHFSEAFWVKFKLFGMLGLLLAFGALQALWIVSKAPAQQTDK